MPCCLVVKETIDEESVDEHLTREESVFIMSGQSTSRLLPPATKLGQGNIFRSVCQELCPKGGMSGQTPPLADTPRSRHPHPLGADMLPSLGADTPREQCMLGDMGNKRAVRIPLEWIIISNFIYENDTMTIDLIGNPIKTATTELINFFMNCKQIIISSDSKSFICDQIYCN